jgi:hypothetical protein
MPGHHMAKWPPRNVDSAASVHFSRPGEEDALADGLDAAAKDLSRPRRHASASGLLLFLLLLFHLLPCFVRLWGLCWHILVEHGLVHLNLHAKGFASATTVKTAHGASIQVVEANRDTHVATVRAHPIGYVESLPPHTVDPCFGPGMAGHFL